METEQTISIKLLSSNVLQNDRFSKMNEFLKNGTIVDETRSEEITDIKELTDMIGLRHAFQPEENFGQRALGISLNLVCTYEYVKDFFDEQIKDDEVVAIIPIEQNFSKHELTLVYSPHSAAKVNGKVNISLKFYFKD